MVAYDRCIASGRADAAIDAESKVLIEGGLQGLPTTFPSARRHHRWLATRRGLSRRLRSLPNGGEGDSGIPAPAYWLMVLALTGAVIWVGRLRRATL